MLAKQTELERMLEDKDEEILELMQEVDKLQHEKSSQSDDKADHIFNQTQTIKKIEAKQKPLDDKVSALFAPDPILFEEIKSKQVHKPPVFIDTLATKIDKNPVLKEPI